jgi:hypothetical protein
LKRLLCPLAVGDVLDCADSARRVALFAELYLRPLSNPFQVIAHDDAVFDVIRGSVQRGRPRIMNRFPVPGVNHVEESFVGQCCSQGHPKDAKHLIRPGEPIAGDVQMPAPDMRDLLRSVQVGLALS